MTVSKWLAGALIGVIAATFTLDAEAQRRLGGGKNFGRQSPQVQQRQATPPQQQTPPAQQAAPAQQPGTAAAPATANAGAAAAGGAARAASPWRGALMGLAAGLGIAALASWLGFGEGFAMLLMVLLIGLVVFMLVGMLMRRARGPQPAYEAAGNGVGGYAPESQPSPQPSPQPAEQPAPLQRSAVQAGAVRPGSAMDEFMRGGAVTPDRPWGVPAGFDVDGFLAHAKEYFAKLQAAWDRGSLDDLQEFTSNEMFIALTHELRARAGATSTEIASLEAALLGIDSGTGEHVASVRFTGSLRVNGETEAVDEVWNLSKPVDGRHGWVLAGIQQLS